ncbi:MAG: NAD(P)-dependent oxidoreductase [Patescibacteria group bacterium]|nr:NAD(P)-dependent oxidoreductase [Patescibacteria group bacterium]
MLKIAITGGGGLVGSRIIELLNNDFEFISLSQDKMNITNKYQVYQILKEINFDILLHLAAYTNVAKANEEKDLAYKINVKGTENIFEQVLSKKKKIIYISTDFIFDGTNPPYFEDSKPKPAGIYGQTKYQGELIVNPKKYSNSLIVRISYPYKAKFFQKKDFFRTFKTLLEEKKPLKMIINSLMTPTFIDDIAYGLRYLINNFSNDIVHLVGSQSLSPYDAAVLIAEKFNLDKNLISKTTFEEYIKIRPGLPQYSQIKSKKNNFWKMKTFEEGINEIINQLKIKN